MNCLQNNIFLKVFCLKIEMHNNKDYHRLNNKLSKKTTMKKIFISVLSVALLLSSCFDSGNKNDMNNTSYWTIGTTQYTGPTISRSNNNLLMGEGTNVAMQIRFASIPTTTGKYVIVDQAKAVSNTLASNECCFEFDNGAIDVYLITGAVGDTANVVITNGKIGVGALHFHVRHYAGGPALDSTYANGNYYQ